MSVSKSVFNKWFRVLSRRFGRDFGRDEIAIEVMGLFFDSVQSLNDNQFIRGCELVFQKDVFFPSPERIVELGSGSADEDVDRVWRVAVDVMDRHGGDVGWGVLLREFPDVAGVLQGSGAWRSLRSKPVGVVRKEFDGVVRERLSGGLVHAEE